MSRNTQFFNQSQCTVILDGVPVEQFSDGDAIRVKRTTEGSTIERGIDGATTTFSTDKSGTVELDLKGVSITLDQINFLAMAQRTGFAREFSMQIVTSALEPIRCEGCSIAHAGDTSTGGRSSSPRTVTINVRKISDQ